MTNSISFVIISVEINKTKKMNIAKYFNLDGLDKVRQQEFVGTLTDYIIVRMADQIGDHLTEAEIAELESLGDSGDSNLVLQWLNEHIPNFSQGVEEVIEEESLVMKMNYNAVASLVG